MADQFNADNLGSFLRPQYLLDAHTRKAPPDELRALEDRAILDVLKMQEEAGIPIVTDGEFRRELFFSTVVAVANGYDPYGYERFHRDEEGHELHFGTPTPVAKLTRKASQVDVEYAFTRRHTNRPIKVTMPSPSMMRRYWVEGRSDKAYASKDEYMNDLIALEHEDAQALAAAGAAYLQIDAPHFAMMHETGTPEQRAHIADTMREMAALDNRVLAGVEGVVSAIHICRGNYRSMFTGTQPYDAYAEALFGALHFDRYLLEYDDYRSGDFSALRFVPPATTVVLGLVTTKRSELEDEETLMRRIEDAAKVIPIERLALSTQCGFASTMEGNAITEEAQRKKLALVVRVAERVWGHA
ncbi:MAG: methionine synthase [Thermomicrobia bacterium]|nr:methionine synthase [Thermomicrobia bacterium]